MKRIVAILTMLMVVAGYAYAFQTGGYLATNPEGPVDQFHFNTAPSPTPTCEEGRLYWNADDSTLNVGVTGNVCLQVGQEQIVRVTNKTGSQINNGQVVYISGAQGNRPTVTLADADTEATSSKTMGVATEDIPDNQSGYVTVMGLVRDIDTSGFSEGDPLWLSTTAGGIVNSVPVSPAHATYVGTCIVSHATEGVILVRIQNGFELYEIHDVLLTNPQADDSLLYNGTLWVNVPHTYGEMYFHTDNGSLDFATTTALINVTGLTNGISSNMTLNATNGSITVIDTDSYAINAAIAARSVTPGEYDFHVGIDGVDQDKCHGNRNMGTAGAVGSVALTCLLELTSGETITLMVNSVGNETIQFEAINFNAQRMP